MHLTYADMDDSLRTGYTVLQGIELLPIWQSEELSPVLWLSESAIIYLK